MLKLGVISDTHGLLRDKALGLLQGVDHIIHAGDIGNPGILERLKSIAPVSAIRGNIDTAAWASDLPETRFITFHDRHIFVIHDRKQLGTQRGIEGVSLVISGHSHRASIEVTHGVIFLNPGSAGPRRFKLPITLGTVEISLNAITPVIHPID